MKIFFDLDGPIIDVSGRYYEVYRKFCALKRLRPMAKERYWRIKRNKEEIFMPKQLKNQYKKFWIKNIESKKNIQFDNLQNQADLILKRLSNKFKLYLITLRQNKKNVLQELSHFKIDKHFKKILVASPLLFKSSKNWQIKQKMIKNIAQSKDVIIGDTRTDIVCGKELNLITIGIASGINNKKILKSFSPDYLVNNARSLLNLEIIKKL